MPAETQVSERAVEVEMGWSFLNICDLLKISHKTLYKWLEAAKLQPACRKSVIFLPEDLDNIATFYVATKVLRMKFSLYTREIVPRSSISPIPGLEGAGLDTVDHLFALESYYRQAVKRDLYQTLLMAVDSLEEMPLFTKNILSRLKESHEYSRAS